MSYCVNCGVELAESERVCPLCAAPVINALDPWKEPKAYPYPKTLERVEKKIDRRYGVILATILLLVPVIVSVMTDVLLSGRVSWSWFVIGGGGCFFVWVLLPFVFTGKNMYRNLFFDVLAALLYLFLIDVNTQGTWFLPVALPIALLVGGCAFIVLYTARHANWLCSAGVVSMLIGVVCVGVECTLDYFVSREIHLFWSLIVFVSLGLIAFAFWFVDRKKKLKEEIHKRLFV